MPVPQEILKLVERFDAQSAAYQSGKYNEAQIRAKFIDPLFKALYWDIHNEQAEQPLTIDIQDLPEKSLPFSRADSIPSMSASKSEPRTRRSRSRFNCRQTAEPVPMFSKPPISR